MTNNGTHGLQAEPLAAPTPAPPEQERLEKPRSINSMSEASAAVLAWQPLSVETRALGKLAIGPIPFPMAERLFASCLSELFPLVMAISEELAADSEEDSGEGTAAKIQRVLTRYTPQLLQLPGFVRGLTAAVPDLSGVDSENMIAQLSLAEMLKLGTAVLRCLVSELEEAGDFFVVALSAARGGLLSARPSSATKSLESA